jgi:hypothetical protein
LWHICSNGIGKNKVWKMKNVTIVKQILTTIFLFYRN